MAASDSEIPLPMPWFEVIPNLTNKYLAFPTLAIPEAKQPSSQTLRKLFYIAATLTCIPWLVISIIFLNTNRSKTEWAESISNAGVLPACIFCLYQVLVHKRYIVFIDFWFIYFTGIVSCLYHMCSGIYFDSPEEDIVEFPFLFCKTEVCTTSQKYRYCMERLDGDMYGKLQGLDFAASYFLLCITFLFTANIQPVCIKMVIYGLIYYVIDHSQKAENRWETEGLLYVIYCATVGMILLLLRLLLNFLRIKHSLKTSACTTIMSLFGCVPKTIFFIGLSLATIGVTNKFVFESYGFENPPKSVEARAHYSYVHGLGWHVPMFLSTCCLVKSSLEFNANCFELVTNGKNSGEAMEKLSIDSSAERGSADML